MSEEKPGRRREQRKRRNSVGILDVAKVAGLSTATVSRALRQGGLVSEQTRARVLAAAQELDYRPNMLARNLRSDRSFAVLVLVPGIANPFFTNVVAGIESVATARGYAVLLGDTRDEPGRENHFIQMVETRLADGLIQLSPDDHVPALSREDYPIVHACGCETTPAPSVRIDNVGAAREIVAHLIASGHKRIATIGGPQRNPHTRERMQGYQQALLEHGLTPDPALTVYGAFTMQSGAEAARHLLAIDPHLTAIFCMNDEMALGALQTCAAAGLSIPEQIAVAGFDGLDLAAHATPALTTLEQPAFRIGARACALLLDRMEGVATGDIVEIMPHRVIVRHSTDASRPLDH